MIQNIIVFLIVALAGVYLARMVWASVSGKKGCNCGTGGGCSKAGAAPKPPAAALIQISLNGKSGPAGAPKSPGRLPDR
jgi:hypothetical protein